jgi:hypothetical protein
LYFMQTYYVVYVMISKVENHRIFLTKRVSFLSGMLLLLRGFIHCIW